MFKKVLIANRGEIACRVMDTLRRMGIASVAVYSDADRDAVHVRRADEAVEIGPAPSAESYLVIDRIVQACLDTGAEAVHPGYGFLSENAEFVQRLKDAGIAFIGPEPLAIEAMGDKIRSKTLAEEAGVNVIPGYTDVVKDVEHAVEISRDVGYPVMIKASAGGGGKGMRIARNDDECRSGFERARSEARSSFGDDRVFIERFVDDPRHIEIQVFGDQHGNYVYLNERECSIQRRHQKVIEEAPSAFVDATLRKAMGEQAVALARAVDYVSAGTVEFIVDARHNFYFLEMNTRLQVEHPVTEKITGVDLVEWMVRVAAGDSLPLSQPDIPLIGWAMESRVYAEDPIRGFLPSVGRLSRYLPPNGDEGIRVDDGVAEGSEISMYYDPMIAKLVSHGSDRDHAVQRMLQALYGYHIRGVHTNIPFLCSVLRHPRFLDANITTHFIDEEYPEGFELRALDESEVPIAAVLTAYIDDVYRIRDTFPELPSLDPEVAPAVTRVVRWAQVETAISITSRRPGGMEAVLGNRKYDIDSTWKLGDPVFEAVINGEQYIAQVCPSGAGYRIDCFGTSFKAHVYSERLAELARLMPDKPPADLSHLLLSPMPGLLVSVSVSEGQKVEAGEQIAVVEAMKMENVLCATRDETIAAVHAQPGQTLEVDQPIVEFQRL